ncbi:MAG: FtsW/RodA/SpoVE family cell cycle protein [Acidobacteria bacterium]|nr:FtsW/RodA/SpoVE family cell cycle protein [Acidobacteriota bacterium]
MVSVGARAGRRARRFLGDGGAASVVVGLMAVLILREPDLGTTLMLGLVFVAMMFAAGVPLKHLFKLSPTMILGGDLHGRQSRLAVIVSSVYRSGEGSAGEGISHSAIADGDRFRWSQRARIWPEQTEAAVFADAAIGFHLRSDFRRAWPDRSGDTDSGLRVFPLARIIDCSPGAGFARPVDRDRTDIGIDPAGVLQHKRGHQIAAAKGITLPFVSAGGSSLVVALAMVGILLNISEQVETAGKD